VAAGPGRRRCQGVRAVGHDQHADGIRLPVDLGAQLPAAGQRGTGVMVAAVNEHLHAGFGLGLAPHPGGQQRTHGKFERRLGAVMGLRGEPNPHVGAESRKGAPGVRAIGAQHLIGDARSDGDPARWQ
jgi:hypothetical protein